MLVGRYRCTCTPGRHTDEEAARKAWGCDERSEVPVWPDPITGGFNGSKHFDLHRCPAGQVGPEWCDLIATWKRFGGADNPGPLPISGGWLDQMQWFADADDILSHERSIYLDARMKEERKKSKSGGAG